MCLLHIALQECADNVKSSLLYYITVILTSALSHVHCPHSLHSSSLQWMMICVCVLNFSVKDDRQRFLQKVSKKQFRTVYYNANACG